MKLNTALKNTWIVRIIVIFRQTYFSNGFNNLFYELVNFWITKIFFFLFLSDCLHLSIFFLNFSLFLHAIYRINTAHFCLILSVFTIFVHFTVVGCIFAFCKLLFFFSLSISSFHIFTFYCNMHPFAFWTWEIYIFQSTCCE